MEEAAGERRPHQGGDRPRAGGLAGDGHLGRIAAERADIAPHPLQRRDLVEQAVIARYAFGRFGAERGMREPAEDAEPVIDRHEDNAAPRKFAAVVHRAGARSELQRAAVDPDDHRRAVGAFGRPDIERQAILAHRTRRLEIDARGRIGRLDAVGAEGTRFANTLPFFRRRGRAPAAFADRRRGIGDAAKDAQPVLADARDAALGDGRGRRFGGEGCAAPNARKQEKGQGEMPAQCRNILHQHGSPRRCLPSSCTRLTLTRE